MESDDIFKKRKEKREKRKEGFLMPKPNSYLIVTEGEKTEPFYFEGLTEEIKQQLGGMLEVVSIPHVEICGEGMSTVSLIKKN